MRRAPRDQKVSRTVRGLLDQNHVEEVAFIGRDYEPLVVFKAYEATREQLRAKRAELLSAGTLKAIVHVGVATVRPVRVDVRCTIVEVFDNPDEPTVHALMSYPGQSFWLGIPDDAAEAWIHIWQD